jgi:hypothetical protein
MDAILRHASYGILGHMYQERVVLAGQRVLEVFFASPSEFQLEIKKQGNSLVRYVPGARVLAGKRFPYEFKSVEKLRYDFEQDAQYSG